MWDKADHFCDIACLLVQQNIAMEMGSCSAGILNVSVQEQLNCEVIYGRHL
jgi:hypothetical protein